MRFDPFRELDSLTQMINRQGSRSPQLMAMDAYREGDRFIVKFDLPGVDPDSVNLTVEKNVLSVRAERTWQPAEGVEVLVSERPQGGVSRQLFLGENLDTEHIEATLKDGVLTLTIPVAEQAKPRRVAIAADGQEGRTVEPRAANGGSQTEDTGAASGAGSAERESQPEPASAR
jgi:HSP20 family protein